MSASKGLSAGRTSGFWETGMLIYTLINIVANLKIMIVSSIHNAVSLISIFGSIVVYFLSFFLWSNLKLSRYSFGVFTM